MVPGLGMRITLNSPKIAVLILLASALVLFARCLFAEEIHVLETGNVKVLFEPALRPAAQEVIDVYPHIKTELENTIGWNLDLTPSVLLIKDRKFFQKMAESPITVAFAVPNRNLIVIDHSRMNTHPFTLRLTLKHELCHLLLHHHIGSRNLPRWFDEGICQWASGGIADIIMDQKRSLLNRAAFKGKFLDLGSLKDGFPSSREGMLLAYEQSKGFVTHIVSKFRKEGLLRILYQMKEGKNIEKAVLKSLSVPLETLEKEWQNSLRQNMTWFTYLSFHLYEILFALMALVSLYAFIKAILKKRAYMADETEDTTFS